MLKFVLLSNGISCAFFGALFLAMPIAITGFIGDPPVLLIQVLGAGLIINALLLFINGLKAQPPRKKVIAFAIGDGIWVLITAVLLIAGLWITTPQGMIASIAVAIFVGLCGFAQWRLAPKI